MSQTTNDGVTFGERLLAQCVREDELGDLACAPKADPKVPRRGGSPDDGRKRLSEMQADNNMHALVDHAETDWMAL